MVHESMGHFRRSFAQERLQGCPRAIVGWLSGRVSPLFLSRVVDAALHVGQVALGYGLMLMAMTYHLPIFFSVLLGLGLGHCLFAYRGGRSGEALGNEPCCPITPVGLMDGGGGGGGVNAPLLSAVVASSSGHTVEARVEGMTCDACVHRVERALLGVEGVISAKVDLASALATMVLASHHSSSGQPGGGGDFLGLCCEAVENVGFSLRLGGKAN